MGTPKRWNDFPGEYLTFISAGRIINLTQVNVRYVWAHLVAHLRVGGYFS